MRLFEFIDDYVGPVVYHGSRNADIERLEPNPSKLMTEPVVFAAILYDVAVAMAGHWTDDDFDFGRTGSQENGHFVRYTMRELRKGAFKEFFDSPTSVYLLPSDDFKWNENLQDFELVSLAPVEPISFTHVDNALDFLRQSSIIKIVELK